MFIDSHCHLDKLDLKPYNNDLSLVIAAAKQREVNHMLCIGIDPNNAEAVIAIAKQHENVKASVGIHPLYVHELESNEFDLQQMREWVTADQVIAVGETGLDYYYNKDSAELQHYFFTEQLKLAAEVAKPVIVHTRDARQDTLSLIRQYGSLESGGVLHCFTESWEMASAAIELNYAISFSGIITFKNAVELREVVKKVPLEKILIETDSPYLSPVPYRGKSNEPQYVVEVAACVAELKNTSIERVAEQTRQNFCELFNTPEWSTDL